MDNYNDKNYIKVNKRVLYIHPIKMKYIKDNFYNIYLCVNKFGLMRLLEFSDGSEILNKFLNAVFDGDKEVIDYVLDEMTTYEFNELLIKVKEINELKDENDLKKN